MIQNFFTKEPIPKKIPKDMQKVIDKLKRCKSKEECLKKAYKIASSKYSKTRFMVYVVFWRNFWKDINKIWHHNGYIQCHVMNYVLRIMLVKSGWFSDKDIELKRTLVWYISPHQYLRVRVGRKFINVDAHVAAFGVPFGEYAHGFHGYTK